jgi:hypothetical protein
MRCTLILAFAALVACEGPDPELQRQLTETAQQMTSMNFDSAASVTVSGHVGTLVWPEGGSGMILIEADGTKYAFSTAKVADMAKQGFTRFALHPGEEVTITGPLASDDSTVAQGFTAARADLVAKADGTTIFDRTKVSAIGAQ